MQPIPLSAVMQAAITACAVCIAAAAITFRVVTARQERNAALVSIGVAVLRADPAKEPQARAAREWALDLIDANAGGVRFSAAVRRELLEKRLGYDVGFDFGDWGSPLTYGNPPNKPRNSD
jgi:hypothetical protein